MGRERKIIVALGAPGMGKSALARELLKRYRGEKHILDPSYSFPEFGGVWPGRKGVTDWIDKLTGYGEGPRKGGRTGLLVLDDCDRYLTSASFDNWRDVWLANRHLGLDVVATAHRPSMVPKDLLGSATELWLFAQEEPRALAYLAEIKALKPTLGPRKELPLPTEPGEALRVVPRSGVVQRVRLWKAKEAAESPPPPPDETAAG